jgi:hypothetical protein
MNVPAAAGRRYLCALEGVPLRDIALILSHHYRDPGFKIPTGRIPKPLLRIATLFDRDLRLVVNDVGQPFRIDASKTVLELGFDRATSPR